MMSMNVYNHHRHRHHRRIWVCVELWKIFMNNKYKRRTARSHQMKGRSVRYSYRIMWWCGTTWYGIAWWWRSIKPKPESSVHRVYYRSIEDFSLFLKGNTYRKKKTQYETRQNKTQYEQNFFFYLIRHISCSIGAITLNYTLKITTIIII